MKELELSDTTECEDDLNYAKQQLGVKSRECGLLGLKWNKLTDEVGVTISEGVAQPTERCILGEVTLQGKLLHRDVCEEKCAWDAPLSAPLERQWQKWSLPQQCPRALSSPHEPFEKIELHALGTQTERALALLSMLSLNNQAP